MNICSRLRHISSVFFKSVNEQQTYQPVIIYPVNCQAAQREQYMHSHCANQKFVSLGMLILMEGDSVCVRETERFLISNETMRMRQRHWQCRQATCRRNENQIYGLNKRCQNARIECLAREGNGDRDSEGQTRRMMENCQTHGPNQAAGKCILNSARSQKCRQLLQLLPPLDICISHINRIRRRQLQSSRHVHVVGSSRQRSPRPPPIGRQTVPAASTASLIEGKIIHVR